MEEAVLHAVDILSKNGRSITKSTTSIITNTNEIRNPIKDEFDEYDILDGDDVRDVKFPYAFVSQGQEGSQRKRKRCPSGKLTTNTQDNLKMNAQCTFSAFILPFKGLKRHLHNGIVRIDFTDTHIYEGFDLKPEKSDHIALYFNIDDGIRNWMVQLIKIQVVQLAIQFSINRVREELQEVLFNVNTENVDCNRPLEENSHKYRLWRSQWLAEIGKGKDNLDVILMWILSNAVVGDYHTFMEKLEEHEDLSNDQNLIKSDIDIGFSYDEWERVISLLSTGFSRDFHQFTLLTSSCSSVLDEHHEVIDIH